jgi:hypothetical protein
MAITNRQLELYEVFENFTKAKDRKEKVQLLQNYSGSAFLTDYLRCVFDDRVQFNLPAGRPPYEAAAEESYPTSWRRQNTKLKYFVKGLSDNTPSYKRESIFIGILETVHPKDAELLVDMINKKTPVKGLTKKIVEEALPQLLK